MKTPKDKARNRERKAEWYRENREMQYARVKANQQRIKAWITEYKSTLSCACGESHLATLDFHHRDPSTKNAEIAKAHLRGWGIDRVKEEIAKCDVLCSNCHRRLHWKERTTAADIPSV